MNGVDRACLRANDDRLEAYLTERRPTAERRTTLADRRRGVFRAFGVPRLRGLAESLAQSSRLKAELLTGGEAIANYQISHLRSSILRDYLYLYLLTYIYPLLH